MKWFDKGDIKGKDALTPEQLDYLQHPSLAICGPFNSIFRKHFDYLLAFILLIVGEAALSLPEDMGLLSVLYLLMNIILQGWLLYFFVKHGRRLAWNRNQWKNFEVFEKSEKKWLCFATASFGMLLSSLYRGWQNLDSETIVGGIVVALVFGIAIALPFFQSWRMKRTASPLSAAQSVSSVSSPPDILSN